MEKRTGLLIKKIHDAITAIANEDLKKYNLTISQTRLLSFLKEHREEPVSIRDIQKELQIKHSTAIGLVERLMEKNMAESFSGTEDRRTRHVRITDTGLEAAAMGQEKQLRLEAAFLQDLTPEEQQQFIHALQCVNRRLQDMKP